MTQANATAEADRRTNEIIGAMEDGNVSGPTTYPPGIVSCAGADGKLVPGPDYYVFRNVTALMPPDGASAAHDRLKPLLDKQAARFTKDEFTTINGRPVWMLAGSWPEQGFGFLVSTDADGLSIFVQVTGECMRPPPSGWTPPS